MTSVEPFRRLVKLVARAFYQDDVVPLREREGDKDKDGKEKEGKSGKQGKQDKGETRGLAVVVLDALTRRQWMKEEELAKQLHLHPKQLRRTLKMLEEEMMVVRESRKEGAITITVGPKHGRQKQHSQSYCALHYPQIIDVVRYRIMRAKRRIKDELESKKEVMELLCPSSTCGQRYSTLDIDRLIDPVDFNPKCERCGSELISEADKAAQEAVGGGGVGENGADGGSDDRRRHKEQLRDMLSRLEKQLQPLVDQIAKVKELTPPYFGTLAEWEHKATPAQRAAAVGLLVPTAGGAGRLGSQSGAGAPMPFVGETKVEITLAGDAAAAGATAGSAAAAAAPQKVIPKWAIREDMQLTAAQRGEAPAGTAPGGGDAAGGGADGGTGEAKEMTAEEKAEKERLEEYYKAYYAALLQQQQQIQQQQAQGGPASTEQQTEAAEPAAAEQAVAAELIAAVEPAVAQEAVDEDAIEWEGGEDTDALEGGEAFDEMGGIGQEGGQEGGQDGVAGDGIVALDEFAWDDDGGVDEAGVDVADVFGEAQDGGVSKKGDARLATAQPIETIGVGDDDENFEWDDS